MPKQVDSIADSDLLKHASELDPGLLISTRQAGLLLGRSVSRLEDDRKAKRPPPFVKLGDAAKSSVRYELGELVRFRNERRFHSTGEARAAVDNRRFAGSLMQFVLEGKADSEWPFAFIEGKPVDFFASLAMNIDEDVECRWVTLDEFLVLRLGDARYQALRGHEHGIETVALKPGRL